MPQSETLRVRGMEVDLLRQGSGDVVLFLHGVQGLTVPPGNWAPFMDVLSERFTVLVPSHPGFGKSERPDWYDSVVELSDHYTDFLDALGLDRVRVVGHSFGGWVAAEWAANAPTRIERLVLASPLGIWLPDAGAQTPNIFMYSPQEVVEFAYTDQRAGADVIPTDVDQSEQWFADWSSFAMYSWLPYLHNPKLIHRLYRIKVPTLVVSGDQDPIVPVAHASAFHEGIRQSQLRIVDGAAHAFPLERPQEFGQLLVEFLDGSVP